MQQATITSKLQLTIPVKIAKQAGVKSGEKVQIEEENGRIVITPLRQLVEELAGSIPVPKKWEGRDIDDIIREAKDEYFKNKYKNKKP